MNKKKIISYAQSDIDEKSKQTESISSYLLRCPGCDGEGLLLLDDNVWFYCTICWSEYKQDELCICSSCGQLMLPNDIFICDVCWAYKTRK